MWRFKAANMSSAEMVLIAVGVATSWPIRNFIALGPAFCPEMVNFIKLFSFVGCGGRLSDLSFSKL
jgi:hypothetical protein